MATLTVQTLAATGSVVTFTAAAGGGDEFANDGKTFFEVNNGGGAPITVTIVAESPCNQGTLHDVVGSVTNGTVKKFGPFDRQRFNDATTGRVGVTYSAVTSVTVAAWKY